MEVPFARHREVSPRRGSRQEADHAHKRRSGRVRSRARRQRNAGQRDPKSTFVVVGMIALVLAGFVLSYRAGPSRPRAPPSSVPEEAEQDSEATLRLQAEIESEQRRKEELVVVSAGHREKMEAMRELIAVVEKEGQRMRIADPREARRAARFENFVKTERGPAVPGGIGWIHLGPYKLGDVDGQHFAIMNTKSNDVSVIRRDGLAFNNIPGYRDFPPTHNGIASHIKWGEGFIEFSTVWRLGMDPFSRALVLSHASGIVPMMWGFHKPTSRMPSALRFPSLYSSEDASGGTPRNVQYANRTLLLGLWRIQGHNTSLVLSPKPLGAQYLRSFSFSFEGGENAVLENSTLWNDDIDDEIGVSAWEIPNTDRRSRSKRLTEAYSKFRPNHRFPKNDDENSTQR